MTQKSGKYLLKNATFFVQICPLWTASSFFYDVMKVNALLSQKKMEKALVFCENFRKRRPIYDMRGIFPKSNLSDLLWTNPPTLKLDIKTLRKKYLMKFSKLYCLFLRLPNLFADIGWVIKIFSAKYIVISKRLFWTMFPPDENND